MRPKPGASLSEIEAVYREGFAEFRRVATAIAGDREAALDVVQEAFGSVIRRRKTFRGEGPLEAWIWRTVVNTALDYARLPPASAPSFEAALAAQNGHPAERGRVAAAVAALPERQRLVLFLRYYADFDYRAIAETLEIRPGTVAATLNAARASLRSALSEVST
jgi:RNA polymerase sigma-70 factor (ECF subfamily)